jgi:hypothetical protein
MARHPETQQLDNPLLFAYDTDTSPLGLRHAGLEHLVLPRKIFGFTEGRGLCHIKLNKVNPSLAIILSDHSVFLDTQDRYRHGTYQPGVEYDQASLDLQILTLQLLCSELFTARLATTISSQISRLNHQKNIENLHKRLKAVTERKNPNL